MTKEEAAVQFYFQLTVGALAFVMVAAVVGFILASHFSSKKLSAHVDRILALPKDQVHVWVSTFLASDDLGEHNEYTLYAQVAGEEKIKLTDNDDRAKWVCNMLASAGRPVIGMPW
jgi:hypothetical protein